MKLHENLAHGAAEAFIHGEPFPPPVARSAQAAKLTGNGAAGFRLPIPHPFDEFFASQVMAGLALFGHLAFDNHLGGNTGMVCSGLPKGIQALHPLVTDKNVLQGIIERVAHMQVAGDIGRRDDNGIGVCAGVLATGESARGFPGRIMFFLDLGRSKSLVQHGWRPSFIR